MQSEFGGLRPVFAVRWRRFECIVRPEGDERQEWPLGNVAVMGGREAVSQARRGAG